MAILAKLSYSEGTGPVTVLVLRYSIAAAILLFVIRAFTTRLHHSPAFRRVWLVAAACNTGAAISFWGAIKLDDVSRVAPVSYLFPALVIVMSRALFGERFGGSVTIAAILGVLGSALVLGGGIAGPSTVAAGGLAVVSAVATAAYYVVTGRAVDADHWLPASAVTFVFGAVVLSPFILATGFEGPTARGWVLVSAIVICGTILPFAFFLAGAPRVGPVHASILSGLEPIFVVLLAVAVLNEHVRTIQAVGIALIVLSLVMATYAQAKASRTDIASVR